MCNLINFHPVIAFVREAERMYAERWAAAAAGFCNIPNWLMNIMIGSAQGTP